MRCDGMDAMWLWDGMRWDGMAWGLPTTRERESEREMWIIILWSPFATTVAQPTTHHSQSPCWCCCCCCRRCLHPTDASRAPCSPSKLIGHILLHLHSRARPALHWIAVPLSPWPPPLQLPLLWPLSPPRSPAHLSLACCVAWVIDGRVPCCVGHCEGDGEGWFGVLVVWFGPNEVTTAAPGIATVRIVKGELNVWDGVCRFHLWTMACAGAHRCWPWLHLHPDSGCWGAEPHSKWWLPRPLRSASPTWTSVTWWTCCCWAPSVCPPSASSAPTPTSSFLPGNQIEPKFLMIFLRLRLGLSQFPASSW